VEQGPGHERRREGAGPSQSEAGMWDAKGLVAVLDTSVLVSAYLSKDSHFSSSRRIVRAVGALYDSFTSPAIIAETERVLTEPRFRAPMSGIRLWLDAFVRRSRQVDSVAIPGDYSAALGGDEKDNPILLTALAVNLHEEGQQCIAEAGSRFGCFIVSGDKHFRAGRNVWG